MPEYDNVQVDITLRDRVAINHPWINGDGLLEYLCAVGEYGREYLELVSKSVIDGPQDLDLDVPVAYTDELAHASVSFFDCTDKYVDKFYKRYGEKYAPYVDSRRTKIPKTSGEFKASIFKQAYYPARECSFYFRGDAGQIAELFENLPHLGVEGTRGYGAIEDIDVRTIETDMSLVHDGVAMRPIPITKLDDWDESQHLSWKAPYWWDENHTQCAPPGAEVELAE